MIRQRCAIYTRKSTEEGLDQSFNSLDAQREACAAYILSQRHEGWSERGDRYDDGGFSGGSMGRPALQRLLDDVRAGRVDVIVVYKVDRLTRSLSDFAKMVEIFDEAEVSFVSVTQSFNTTSSMGRLTLNVLLSFAQFEREVTAERIRDKIAASKRKGLWMGGAVPMGYDARDRALVVNEAEAEAVRTIFREYLALGSVPALVRRLAELGIVSKRRTDRHGRTRGGGAFSRGALYNLLQNPVYIGKVRQGDALHPGQHAAIVDPEIWQRAQKMRADHGGGRMQGTRRTARRWLDGLIFDTSGRPMRTSYACKVIRQGGGTRRSRRYWYYVSKLERGAQDARPERLPAVEIERAVAAALPAKLADRKWLVSALTSVGASAQTVAEAIECAAEIVGRASQMKDGDVAPILRPLLNRIDLRDGQLQIGLKLAALTRIGSGSDDAAMLIEVPFTTRQNGRARPIVVHTSNDAPRRDPDLIAMIADARRWMAELVDGASASVAEITHREGLRKGAVSRILPLASLAPDIAVAIFEGRQPIGFTAKRLRDLPEMPLDWREQRRLLGFAPT